MILSDQQFEEIRQECPCFYYNTGVDESRCTATGEAKCFAARCPFLFWDKIKDKFDNPVRAKDFLMIANGLKETNEDLLKLSEQMSKKESPWAFTDDRGEQPAHYTKEYLLEILDCYKRLSGIDKSFESARKCHEHDNNRLMQTLDKKNEEIEKLKVTIEKQNASLRLWADKYSEREKDWMAMLRKRENIIDELKEEKNQEIQSLQKRLTEINDMIRPIFSISNIPRGSKITSGGSSAGAKTLATNDIEQGKEETIKYHPV